MRVPAKRPAHVSRGAWVFSAVTVATVAGDGYRMAVTMCRSHGIGVYPCPRSMPAVCPLLLDEGKTRAGTVLAGVHRRDC